MLFAQRRPSSSLSLCLHRPVRIESLRSAGPTERVAPPAGASNRHRPVLASRVGRSNPVQVVLTSRGARAVPLQGAACDVSQAGWQRRSSSRSVEAAGAPSGAADLAAAPATVGVANGTHHAIELVGACMMIGVFLILALFA